MDMTALTAAPRTETNTTTGNYFMEVLLPVNSNALPAIDGWTLKLWPTATFGDATLQAVGAAPIAELTHALHLAGIEALSVTKHR